MADVKAVMLLTLRLEIEAATVSVEGSVTVEKNCVVPLGLKIADVLEVPLIVKPPAPITVIPPLTAFEDIIDPVAWPRIFLNVRLFTDVLGILVVPGQKRFAPRLSPVRFPFIIIVEALMVDGINVPPEFGGRPLIELTVKELTEPMFASITLVLVVCDTVTLPDALRVDTLRVEGIDD